jgi:uncharacterized protein involved in type VI secretion and phage assembly
MGNQDMGRMARVMHSRDYVGAAEFTAKCKTCGVKVGRETVVHLPETFKDTFFKDLGSFLVLEVHHKIESPGKYENTFRGITINSETLPDDHIVVPMAFPEPATVVDNADPRNQGRVKVRFIWQAQDASTNWIRVQTPDAGKSDAVARNRGMVFIPEVGDQVMVGYQHGHPERPYVMGSLFHRDNSSGAASDNTIKTISTRSGHVIEFNDDEKGKWGITIKDKNGNLVHLDTAGKNIEITAPETMTLRAKNVNIDASENMLLSSGNNTSQSVGKDFSQSVSGNFQSETSGTLNVAVTGETTVAMDNNLTHNVAGKLIQKVETLNVTAEGGTAAITAKDELTLKSAAEVIIAQ